MALWNGLGQAATVAQLVGADVGGLISMIMQAALTARQNRKECEQLARRVFMIAELLPHIQDAEAARQLAGLGDTLRDAHELVKSCQERSVVYQLVMAGRQAERFREVQSKIDFYLILFPVISHIGITRRLDRIYNALVQDDSTKVEPSLLPQSSSRLQKNAQEVLPHGIQEFTLVEIMAATNNFGRDTIGDGGFGKVYRGTLQDGREVAVKRNYDQEHHSLTEYHGERNILSSLRHENIIRLLGWCVSKEHKGRLTWRRKVPNMEERLFVYEYMENGSLDQHLHPRQGSSSLSPVTVSWKVRISVLVGLSRAIEHLQCHTSPRIIHHDIKPSNILLDASWVPHLSDFGLSLEYPHMVNEVSGLETRVISTLGHMDPEYNMANEESGLETRVMGSHGYADPEYVMSGWVKPSSDIYGLGVVMLEVLSGKRPYTWSDGEEVNAKGPTSLIMLALPIIEAGNLGELLDKRPVPEPTPGQLQALELVAQTAARCVQLVGKDRPAISDIVASLETALELIYRDELGSNRRHARGIPSTGSPD